MANKKGYVNGSDILLYIGEKAVGHCTTHTTTFNAETKERAVKPGAAKGISAGLWKGKGVVGLSIAISVEGLRFYGEDETGFKAILKAWKAGESIEVKCMERGVTENDTTAKPYLKGKFVITKLDEQAPAQDDTTFSCDLENDGEPEVLDESAITETPDSAT